MQQGHSGISADSLMIAVRSGDLGEVETLISLGMDLRVQDAGGNTLLHMAAIHNHAAVAAALLEANVPHDLPNNDGFTALEVAAMQSHAEAGKIAEQIQLIQLLLCKKRAAESSVYSHPFRQLIAHNNPAAVEMLIRAGADVRESDESKETALHQAASQGSAVIIRLLLAAGADVNATDIHGRTPLHSAVLFKHESAVQELLNVATIDISCVDSEGRTALHLALLLGGHVTIIDRLLAAGINIHAQNIAKQTVLHLAANFSMFHSVVEKLLLAGANPSAVDHEGRTALHYAAKRGDLPLVKILAGKSDPFVCSSSGKTALIEAAEMNRARVVDHLFPHYCALKHLDDYCPPLIQAAHLGLSKAITVLLEHDGLVDIEERDRCGYRALEVAAIKCAEAISGTKQYKEIIVALMEFAKKYDPKNPKFSSQAELISGIKRGHAGIVKGLLAAEMSPVADLDAGLNPLAVAASEGHIEIVNALLNASPYMGEEGYLLVRNALRTDNKALFLTMYHAGYHIRKRILSPFQVISYFHCSAEIVAHLPKMGIAVNADYGGERLLQTAIRQGNPLIVRRLIEAGADVNAADARGKTPLFAAVQIGNAAIIRSLLANGARLEEVNEARETPLIFAARLYRIAAVEALIAAGASKDAKNAAGKTAYQESLYHNDPLLSDKLR